jgi:hypothetical protein
MPADIPLMLQTTYAELLDRAAAAFSDAFPEDGAFTPKTVSGRRYWYFQSETPEGRRQRYVGPETPELLQRIADHKRARGDERERRALVSTLVRSAHLPRPLPAVGEVLAGLARAGVFRLRAVLVGTIAYQTYGAMLAARLPAAAVQTGDIDVAQFADVSVAAADRTPAMLDVLRRVDSSFRPVPNAQDRARVASYAAASGLRVHFLTPNRGPDTDRPRPLPALGTDAQPLRFLDFLICDPVPAVLLHGAGVHVTVPAPERYALHKLIIARRRPAASAKSGKDILQATALIEVLLQRARREDLFVAFAEAWDRGESWRRHIGEGLGLIDAAVRDKFLLALDAPRSIVPSLKLQFAESAARYDLDRDVVDFLGAADGSSVRCAISREALEDHFDADGLDKSALLRRFRENREEIEALAARKYLRWKVDAPATVLIATDDVPQLRKSRRKDGTGIAAWSPQRP